MVHLYDELAGEGLEVAGLGLAGQRVVEPVVVPLGVRTHAPRVRGQVRGRVAGG